MKAFNVINYLIEQEKYQSYLEIGIKYGDTYLKVNCEKKYASDIRIKISGTPKGSTFITGPSDDFFKNNTEKFDIIFIDGGNDIEQINKDIFNSLNVLNDGGTIVMPNCYPKELSELTELGDFYKALISLRYDSFTEKIGKIKLWTIDMEHGICVIKKEETIIEDNSKSLKNIFSKNSVNELTIWETFNYYKDDITNMIKFSTFLDIFNTEFLKAKQKNKELLSSPVKVTEPIITEEIIEPIIVEEIVTKEIVEEITKEIVEPIIVEEIVTKEIVKDTSTKSYNTIDLKKHKKHKK